MPTIGKIIIAIAVVYIIAVLIIMDFSDLSWANNSENYWKLIAGVLFILIQFRLKTSAKK